MLTLCYSAKGGSGTTVVVALAGMACDRPTLLVDLDDELDVALGLAPHDRPGVADWVTSAAPSAHLDDLLITLNTSTTLLTSRTTRAGRPRGGPLPSGGELHARWEAFAEWSRSWASANGGVVLLDAGTQPVPAPLAAVLDERWMITRPCYLSLQRATRLPMRPTGVVLITEPGRSLVASNVEAAVGAPVIASTPWDPAVARAVDAGLLAGGRVPRSIGRDLARLMRAPRASRAA
ncbi:MAG: hypothetical protein ACE37B_13330 [Ilumatobacter sp.]|jgi:hypothetical protein|uniref:hypothetical protein n=1 Tax=Ilumatobacter sp. TaxID=1967498 RepID=UPI003918E2E2